MAVLHPVVLWAQRKEKVFASIQLDSIKDEKITIDSEKLTFSCHCPKDGKSYSVELAFFDDIVPEESQQKKGGREFSFSLKKKNTDADWWPRLLKTKAKNQFIKVDFHRWVDEDEADEEKADNAFDNAGMEEMMKGMSGGGQGFDPGEMDMDGPESDDSDDDEIPDLVEEEKK